MVIDALHFLQRNAWEITYNSDMATPTPFQVPPLNKRKRIPMRTIQAIVRHIAEKFAPEQIILFGSHARGDAGPESDIDLLVVFPQVANKRLAAVAIRRTLADLPVCKDVIVTTPAEIARRGDLVGTLLRPALREGKVLYERS